MTKELKGYDGYLRQARIAQIIQADLERADLSGLSPKDEFRLSSSTLQIHAGGYEHGFGWVDVQVNEQNAHTAVARVLAQYRAKVEDWEKEGQASQEMEDAVRRKATATEHYPFKVSPVMVTHTINGEKQRALCRGVSVSVDLYAVPSPSLKKDCLLWAYEDGCVSLEYLFSSQKVQFRKLEDANKYIDRLVALCEKAVCPACDGDWECDCYGQGCAKCEGHPVCDYCNKGAVYVWKDSGEDEEE